MVSSIYFKALNISILHIRDRACKHHKEPEYIVSKSLELYLFQMFVGLFIFRFCSLHCIKLLERPVSRYNVFTIFSISMRFVLSFNLSMDSVHLIFNLSRRLWLLYMMSYLWILKLMNTIFELYFLIYCGFWTCALYFSTTMSIFSDHSEL